MTSTASPVPQNSTVELLVPLGSEFGSIVRLVAASLGADAGFSVDDIDDLRLAVSEVFSSLVSASPSHRSLTARFDTSGPGLRVTMLATSVSAAVLPLVLDDLASSIISASVDEFSIDEHSVTLTKRGSELAVDTTAR